MTKLELAAKIICTFTYFFMIFTSIICAIIDKQRDINHRIIECFVEEDCVENANNPHDE